MTWKEFAELAIRTLEGGNISDDSTYDNREVYYLCSIYIPALNKEYLDEQEQKGVTVANAMGFGPIRPVRSNDTEQDRSFNRRVEIWVL